MTDQHTADHDTHPTPTDVTALEVTIAPEDIAESHPLLADAPVAPQAPTFADLQVDPRIVQALTEAGIERTFAIQALTLPVALVGSDLIGQARTGMGKTLGFGVPLLHRLAAADKRRDEPDAPLTRGRAPRALVMVPTRELCVQVTRDLHDAAKHLGLVVTAVYGGRAYEPQIAALQAGVDVVVGTPGRLLDLAKGGHLVLGAASILVLDEADEMLDLGFLPDIEQVLGMVPDVKQTMLFSATMPGPIITLARSFMRQPLHIRAEEPDEGATHTSTKQFVYRAHAMDKVELLSRVLQAEGRGLTMVFTRTKRTAQKVSDELEERGFAAAAVHGDLGQGAREQALRAFRAGKVDVLVATDVAARGIDVDDVTHVINYQCPDDEKTYIHRIGRTGRAGKTGVAVSLVDWDDIPKWQFIDKALNLGNPDPQETYSSSAHLRSDLGIADSVTGRLPRAQRTRAGLDAETLEDVGETGGKKAGRVSRTRSAGAGRDGGSDNGRSAAGRESGTRSRTRGGDRAATPEGERTPDRAAEHISDHGPDTSVGDAAATRPRRKRRRRTRSGAAVDASSGGAPAGGAGNDTAAGSSDAS
ncbi:DEAD/DEAH box helicase [Nakamurella sp. A5-74]|uniref:RNA helicase n=1 Tax=Nakamurella sp. A5-74 TaxID=3158264 RepID=A0AAU8DJ51_9ACTN